MDIHAPWLFAAMERPDLAYKWVRWTMETWYSTQGDGLAGNDDGGTLSAWYVWAAMGIYPLAGTDRYLLTTPMFDQIEIERPDGIFTITRDVDAVPSRVLLNGEALDGWELTHEQLRGGSCLHFESD